MRISDWSSDVCSSDLQLFTEARTFNGYLDKPVPVEMLHALWDLMKMGPTSANQLPARIVWCVSQEAKDKLAGLASGNNAPKIQAAPVAAILAMDENFHDYLPEPHPASRSEVHTSELTSLMRISY